jgi:hypothetical protein
MAYAFWKSINCHHPKTKMTTIFLRNRDRNRDRNRLLKIYIFTTPEF